MHYYFIFMIAFRMILVYKQEEELKMSMQKEVNCVESIILDSINEGVFTIDMNWQITNFNQAAERITGIKRTKALGQLCYDVFRSDICEKDCALRRTLSANMPILNATAHIINKDGSPVPISISTALLKDDDGHVVGGVETFQDLSQIEILQKELQSSYTFEDIVGKSVAMKGIFDMLPQVADSSSTVLIEGASGTGKELFARAIHNISPRKHNRFIAVNCAAMPDTLLESELFGYKSGAFTDAKHDKPGRFALADGGTIFLDEINDISPAMQVRLLRVLEDYLIEPLGSVEPVKVDIRVVAATNKNLKKLVSTGSFREDLYYRIKVIHLKLPLLRQRREDIPLLVNHLINKFNNLKNRDIVGISDEVLKRLMEYNYPGNVRELENIIEQAFVVCRGQIIELHHLPPEFRTDKPIVPKETGSISIRGMEKSLITEALQRNKGNRKQVALDLGIDVSTLYRKIKALGIDAPEVDGRSRKKTL
jgi:PAS domain S-box-containing protein